MLGDKQEFKFGGVMSIKNTHYKPNLFLVLVMFLCQISALRL